MVYFAKWKIATIIAICLIGLVYAAPNFIPGRGLEGLPTWIPVQKINLGLDLQGGSHLLLEVEADAVIRDRAQALEGVVRTALRPANVGYTDLGTTADGAEVGVWEITPGVVSDIEEEEIFIVLSGRATVAFANGQDPIEVRAGSVVRLAAGMSTTWTVHETVRKVYVIPPAGD